jgi:predicted nucleic acid-binding protein
MTNLERLGKELLDEMTSEILAMSSVPNYEELESKAKELATEDYQRNKDIAEFARIYNYIMKKYHIDEEELIENFLSDAYMLKLAIDTDSEYLIAYAKNSLMNLRSWFEDREDADETAVYNFFNKQLE